VYRNIKIKTYKANAKHKTAFFYCYSQRRNTFLVLHPGKCFLLWSAMAESSAAIRGFVTCFIYFFYTVAAFRPQ